MDEESSLPRYQPPRRGVAGKTGTWQIVFRNGAIVTIPRAFPSVVEFYDSNTGERVKAIQFYSQYASTTSPVSYNHAWSTFKNTDEEIVGFFRIEDDSNSRSEKESSMGINVTPARAGDWFVARIPGHADLVGLDVTDVLDKGDAETAKVVESVDQSGDPVTLVFIKNYRP